METNISAVDWLAKTLVRKNLLKLNSESLKSIKQANQMFEQQTKDAYNEGVYLAMTPNVYKDFVYVSDSNGPDYDIKNL